MFQGLKERNVLVILNTGYNLETAESLTAKLGWKKGKEFDGLITASNVENNRRGPEMILLAMKPFGITDASEVMKVGDSIIDIKEGKNAGCSLNIGITTRAHTREQLKLAERDYIIDDPGELLRIID